MGSLRSLSCLSDIADILGLLTQHNYNNYVITCITSRGTLVSRFDTRMGSLRSL